MRRGAELAFHLPDDFNEQAPSKYGSLDEKSIPAASAPALIEFVCIREHAGFGVFCDLQSGQGLIAKVPLSWGSARSSRLVAPCPDGGIEKPASLLKPFDSADEALKIFQRLSSPSKS